MLKQCLIIIPFHLPWNWSADYQSQTCRELAKNNLVVAYMSQHARFFLKPSPTQAYPKIKNLLFFKPRYLLPFRRFAVIEKLNQLLNIFYLLGRYGMRKKRAIVWMFDPVFWFYPAVRYCYPKVISLYDCVDYVWSRDAAVRRRVQDMEKRLIRGVNLFFVNSRALAHLHTPLRRPDAVVPQGFRLVDFRSARASPAQFPKDKPTIGYVGALNHRLDFRLLDALIKRNPQWRFIVWGSVQKTDPQDEQTTTQLLHQLSRYANVSVGKSSVRSELPFVIKQFDIAIVPYDVELDAVVYSYPMKLWEYFYMGKPVISTPIEELKRFPKYVRIGSNAREWERHIEQLLAKPWPSEYQRKQRKMAIVNSWEKKIEAISRIIQSKT